MYFGFVPLLTKEREKFWDLFDTEEKRTALFCWLVIVFC
jgi:hypothetical protein